MPNSMKLLVTLTTVLLLPLAMIAQGQNREQKVEAISKLRTQIDQLEKDLLQPDPEDVELAQKQGFEAFRLLPRGKYEKVLVLRGAGAYYTFTKRDHEYNYGSDIHLQQDNFEVGFAGADYGFFIDLGERPLAEINKETAGVGFLASDAPPEPRRSRKLEVNGFTYARSVPAVVGRSYILRSINFGDWDVLIALNVVRKDPDGSLVVFWKPLETFTKPEIQREPISR